VQVRYAQRLQIFARMSTFGMRITKLICFGVIFLHWNACAQFLVAAAAEFPDGSWVVRMDILDDSMFTHYTWAMFMASSQMFCIGYGATTPYLVQEVRLFPPPELRWQRDKSQPRKEGKL